MSRRDWTEIAATLGDLRRRLIERRHIARAEGVELAARAICRTLRVRSPRFDGRRFMQIVLGS